MSPPAADSTVRFSDRVADYVRYRPGYPPALLDALIHEFKLHPDHVIADIGAGTGISSEIFLRNGNAVIGVEPNAEMRSAAEKLFGARYPRFRTVDAPAESTTLPVASVDWVVAAQAFHWFDPVAARQEFLRILRPPRRIALIWNNRREDTPFLADYEDFVRGFASDYAAVKHQNTRTDGRLTDFFGGMHLAQLAFPNQQRFDFDGLLGRVCSSSYMPARDTPRYDAMAARLRALFNLHAERHGDEPAPTVAFEYETVLYVGTAP